MVGGVDLIYGTCVGLLGTDLVRVQYSDSGAGCLVIMVEWSNRCTTPTIRGKIYKRAGYTQKSK